MAVFKIKINQCQKIADIKRKSVFPIKMATLD